jgi:hypothetical protein
MLRHFITRRTRWAMSAAAMISGIEILTNAVNTILRGRFLTKLSDGAAFLWSVNRCVPRWRCSKWRRVKATLFPPLVPGFSGLGI